MPVKARATVDSLQSDIANRRVSTRHLIWLWLLCGICSLLPPAHSADEVQIFISDADRRFRGVVVREQKGTLVVATPTGIETWDFRNLEKRGSLPVSAREVHKILVDIDTKLKSRRFDTIPTDLQFLRKEFESYQRGLSAQLKSSGTPEANRQALNQAVDYYRSQIDAVEPTIAVLRRVDEIGTVHEQYMNQRLPTTLESLRMLAGLAKELKTAAATQRLAVGEQAVIDASEKVVAMITGITFLQRQAAYDRLLAEGDTEQAVELLRELGGIYPVVPDVAAAQATMVNDLLAFTDQERQKSIDAIAKSVRYEGEKVIIDAAVQVATKAEMAKLNGYLTAIEAVLFGEQAGDLKTKIAVAREANLGASQGAQKQHSGFQKLSEELAAARRSLDAGDFELAVSQFAALTAKYREQGLDMPQLAKSIADGHLKAQALQRLAILQSPPNLPDEALKKIGADNKRWAEENAIELPAVGVPLELFGEALTKLGNLLRFHDLFATLKADADRLPVETWERVNKLDDWLTRLDTRIHPKAVGEWTAWLAENRESVFVKAVQSFVASPRDLKSEDDQALFETFFAYYTDAGNLAEALKLVDSTLAHVHRTNSGNPYFPQLLLAKLELAKLEFASGDSNQAVAIFNSLEEEYPEFAAIHKNTLGSFSLGLARQAEQSGDLERAETMYLQLCQRYPAVAAREDLYVKLVDLQTRNLKDEELNTEATYEFLDAICKKYPDKLSEQATIAQVGRSLVDGFMVRWEAGDGVAGLADLKAFAELYPSLARESVVMDTAVRQVQRSLRQIALDTDHPVPPKFIDAMQVMFEGEFKTYSKTAGMDTLYVQLLLKHADESIKNGRYTKAFDVYDKIIREFPEVAEREKIRDLQDQKRWSYRLERVSQPLRLESVPDYVALVGWCIVWLFLLYDTIRQSRRNGFAKYRFKQLGTVFGVFVGLMAVFLFFHMSHAPSTILSLFVPGLVFNLLGFSTYLFFPMIYAERRLSVERFIHNYVNTGQIGEWLRLDIGRLEDDMPVLHDRRLFLLERAKRASEGHPERAYETFEKVLQRLDKEIIKDETWREIRFECLVRMGLAAMADGRAAEGAKLLLQYLEHNPRHMRAQRLVSEYLYNEGEYDDAIPHLKVCLTGAAQDDDLWFRLGRCFFETNRPVAAYKCYETATERTRDNLFFSARAYARAGKLPQAIKLFQQVLKVDSRDGEAIYYLAGALASAGEDKKAVKVLRLVPSEHAYFSRVLTLRGNLLLRKGDAQGAATAFAEALTHDPDSRTAMLGQSQALIDEGRYDQALEALNRLTQKFPDMGAAQYLKGVVMEQNDPQGAIAHLTQAATDPVHRVVANRRLARLYFRQGDYGSAVEHFEEVYDEDRDLAGTPPGVLLLHAWSAAAIHKEPMCNELVNALLVAESEDPRWLEIAPRAIYRLGIYLFESEFFHLASLCFGRASSLIDDPNYSVHIDDLLREMRFRRVVKLHQEGDFTQADTLLAELRADDLGDHHRFVCSYYSGLNRIFQHDFLGARKIFRELCDIHGADPRLVYHLAVAELGAGNHSGGAKLVEECDKLPGLAYHLKLGLVTMRAYLEALRSRHAEAEALLDKIPPAPPNVPGAAYVREQIALARIFYLCHLQDVTRIQFLMSDLSEEGRAEAVYLQAVANLGKGKTLTVLKNLQPFAHISERNRRLFSVIALNQAKEMLTEHGMDGVRGIIDMVPDNTGVVKILQDSYRMNDALKAAEDGEDSPDVTIEKLNHIARGSADPMLLHSLGHNLRIFHLQRAIAIEGTEEDVDENDVWQECLAVWNTYLFESRTYWNLSLERLGTPGQNIKPFNAHEIDVVNQKAKDDNLVRTFRGFAITYLQAGDFGNAKRHLAMIRQLGQADSRLHMYMTSVLSEVENVLKNIDRDDPVTNTWDFVITSVALQLEIHETLGNNPPDLKFQLELFLRTREHFNSPADFHKARRTFNTAILDTLQMGIRGQFVTAGERLAKVLTSVPAGMSLGTIERELMKVREYCRNPERAEQNGVRLEREFEKLYQKVRHYDFTKGVSDAVTADLI